MFGILLSISLSLCFFSSGVPGLFVWMPDLCTLGNFLNWYCSFLLSAQLFHFCLAKPLLHPSAIHTGCPLTLWLLSICNKECLYLSAALSFLYSVLHLSHMSHSLIIFKFHKCLLKWAQEDESKSSNFTQGETEAQKRNMSTWRGIGTRSGISKPLILGFSHCTMCTCLLIQTVSWPMTSTSL